MCRRSAEQECIQADKRWSKWDCYHLHLPHRFRFLDLNMFQVHKGARRRLEGRDKRPHARLAPRTTPGESFPDTKEPPVPWPPANPGLEAQALLEWPASLYHLHSKDRASSSSCQDPRKLLVFWGRCRTYGTPSPPLCPRHPGQPGLGV